MTSPSLERFRHELRRMWSLLGTINWSSPGFSADKAYVAAVVSKIAYLAMPEIELSSHSNVKVIPCLTHRQLVNRGIRIDLKQLLGPFDFGEVITIPMPYVVAVIVFGHDVTFVALRGTRPLYLSDWMIDFHFTKTPVYVDPEKARMHSGFFRAVSTVLDALSVHLARRSAASGTSVPVYVVGHSLGGAMAAIMHALAGTTHFSKLGLGQDVHVPFNTHSCYTFGMPRYGDTDAVRLLRGPHHVYQVSDAIPGFPPRWAGFDDAPLEYRLDRRGSLTQRPKDPQGMNWWMSRVSTLRGLRFHFIERYIHEIR